MSRVFRLLPAAAYVLLYATVIPITLYFYPYRVDPPEAIRFEPTPEAQQYYDAAYDAQQQQYEARARDTAQTFRIKEAVQEFVAIHRLARARVLEVGAGQGLLQDLVDDYTGLDISATVRRQFHKPFVQADARAMPFEDGAFDAIWTIWVLEHVPNPEQALLEMRRVLKPNGLLYLRPAWLCSPLASNGYPARPYSDFSLWGKLIKASVPIQRSPAFEAMHLAPTRAIRLAQSMVAGGPTRLHYRPLNANYRDYWMADSDAVNSIDMFEAYLWFASRGDVCVNCPPVDQLFHMRDIPLIIRVKPTAGRGLRP